MAKRGVETLIVKRGAGNDRFGAPLPVFVVGSLTGCIAWPRQSTEADDRGTIIIDGYNVFCPAPVAIAVLATDIIGFRNQDWQVEGAVGDWRKNGVGLGIMMVLKRTGI